MTMINSKTGLRVLCAMKDAVRAEGWTRAFEFNTARGYAMEYGENPEEAHQRSRGFGHDTAYSINAGSALVDSAAARQAIMDREADRMARSVVLATGDRVMIEGEIFIVRINGAKFADPIAFKLVAE